MSLRLHSTLSGRDEEVQPGPDGVIGIYACGPTVYSRIHIGNARTAILNWLMACRTGGQFVLRYDDTDTARSKQEFADGIAHMDDGHIVKLEDSHAES